MNSSLKKVNVMMTCAGSPMVVEMLSALSQMNGIKSRVIAVDSGQRAVGRAYSSAFYQVPPGNHLEYPETLLGICKKEEVTVVIAGSDEESLSLAKNVDLFQKEHITCTVPKKELIDPLSDKVTMYQWLQTRGITVPTHYRARSQDELKQAANALGYPKKSFIVKPSASRGGRGVWVVSSNASSMNNLSQSLAVDAITLENLSEMLKYSPTPVSLMAMEHLEGDVFDVDLLAREQQIYYLIPRRRFHPRTVPFRGCTLEKHDGVLNLCKKLQSLLSLTYLFDFDIVVGTDNVPHLLEVNPRLSGSTIATISAGINLLEYLVRMALNLDIPILSIPYGAQIIPSYKTTCFKK